MRPLRGTVDILHFCGHGSDAADRRTILFDGLAAEDFAAGICAVQPACVVLSACRTRPEAEAIARQAQRDMDSGAWKGSLTVVYWNSLVESDRLLGAFAEAFYKAVGAHQLRAHQMNNELQPGSAEVFEEAYMDMARQMPWAARRLHSQDSDEWPCCATLQHERPGYETMNRLEALQVVRGSEVSHLVVFGLPELVPEPEVAG